MSVVLAVASPVAAGLGVVLLEFITTLPSPMVAGAGVATIVLYAGGLLTSITATVIGMVALVRSRRYQPQQAQRGRAVAGLVLGIVVTILLVFPGGFFFLLSYACAVNQMCV